jgi:MFS family permease
LRYISTVKYGLLSLWSDGKGPILVAVTSGWFLSMGVRIIYPVLLPNIRKAYDLDLTTAGLVLTVLFLSYGIGQFPGGIIADRFGERKIMTASTLISSLTLVLFVTATSVTVLFVSTALFGFGLALYAVSRYTILAEVYPNQVGAANGTASAGSDAGQSLLPPIASVIAAATIWQAGLGFTIPLLLLAGVGIWWIVPPASTEASNTVDTLSLETLQYMTSEIRQKSVIRGTAILLLGVSLWQAFTGFYPTYLIEIKGLSAPVASGLFGLFFLLGVIVQPLSGRAYDQIGIRRSLTIAMSISGGALLALPFVGGFWPLLVLTVLTSTMLGFATITQSYLIISLSEDIQGFGFGLLRTISFTIGSTSPVLFGAAADQGLFNEGFIILAALAGAVVIFAQWLPDD